MQGDEDFSCLAKKQSVQGGHVLSNPETSATLCFWIQRQSLQQYYL